MSKQYQWQEVISSPKKNKKIYLWNIHPILTALDPTPNFQFSVEVLVRDFRVNIGSLLPLRYVPAGMGIRPHGCLPCWYFRKKICICTDSVEESCDDITSHFWHRILAEDFSRRTSADRRTFDFRRLLDGRKKKTYLQTVRRQMRRWWEALLGSGQSTWTGINFPMPSKLSLGDFRSQAKEHSCRERRGLQFRTEVQN